MDLLDIVKSYLPDVVVEEISRKTGETKEIVSSVINTSIPLVIGSLISKSSSDSHRVAVMAREAFSSGQLANPTAVLDQDHSSKDGFRIKDIIQNDIFGNKANDIIQELSSFSGAKESSTTSILNVSSLATLGAIGKQVKEDKLDSRGLSSFLGNLKNHVSSWIPAGFDLEKTAGILGLSGLFLSVGGNQSETATSDALNDAHGISAQAAALAEEPQRKGWLIPLVILLALAGFSWSLLKGCNPNEATPADEVTEVSATIDDTNANATMQGQLDDAGNWYADQGADKTITLPDGTELTVGENSTEYQLYHFITSDFAIDTTDKTRNWVSFDRVFFETGKDLLTDASQKQIQNIALILKNFPNATIKIGGYTDNTGSADINTKISQDRADAVAKFLKESGAATEQIDESVGYGPLHPVASNETPEGKAQNRRVDLKLASK